MIEIRQRVEMLPSWPNTVSGRTRFTPGVSIGTRIMLWFTCLWHKFAIYSLKSGTFWENVCFRASLTTKKTKKQKPGKCCAISRLMGVAVLSSRLNSEKTTHDSQKWLVCKKCVSQPKSFWFTAVWRRDKWHNQPEGTRNSARSTETYKYNQPVIIAMKDHKCLFLM